MNILIDRSCGNLWWIGSMFFVLWRSCLHGFDQINMEVVFAYFYHVVPSFCPSFDLWKFYVGHPHHPMASSGTPSCQATNDHGGAAIVVCHEKRAHIQNDEHASHQHPGLHNHPGNFQQNERRQYSRPRIPSIRATGWSWKDLEGYTIFHHCHNIIAVFLYSHRLFGFMVFPVDVGPEQIRCSSDTSQCHPMPVSAQATCPRSYTP